MHRLNALKDRLAAAIAERQQQYDEDHSELESKMTNLLTRRLRFAQLSPEMFAVTIEPRLQLFAEFVDEFLYSKTPQETRGVIAMNRNRRYAASIELEVVLGCDSQVEHVLVSFQLRIIPILMKFEGKSELKLPLDEVTQDCIADFIDSKLEAAMRSYLELTNNPHYLQESLVFDPVCGMTFHRDQIAESINYQGQEFHFCAKACKQQFEQNPEKFSLTLK